MKCQQADKSFLLLNLKMEAISVTFYKNDTLYYDINYSSYT